MRPLLLLPCLLLGLLPALAGQAPKARPGDLDPAGVDWLVSDVGRGAGAYLAAGGRELVLANGLVRRTFRLAPDLACVAFDDLVRGASLLRSVRPEARLVLNGKALDVGGLKGQPNHAWLSRAWLDSMTADPAAMHFTGYAVGIPGQRLAWKRVRHHAPDARWPPEGVALRLDFEPPAARRDLQGVRVSVHYELYSGIPVLCKWLVVRNGGRRPLEVDRFTSEILAVVEHGNHVEIRGERLPVPDSLHVETDYAFGSFKADQANRFAVHWVPDPLYATQVNYLRRNPCLLMVEPTRGPGVIVPPGGAFTSFRTFELVQDSTDRERRGLAQRRMYRTIAPWVTENPLILHVVSTDPAVVRTAVDQAAECGFEMVSLSFGSGLNMEDEDPVTRKRFRDLATYAAGKGIHLGGYSLLSSRRIHPDGDNCINPGTGKPGGQTHGFCPALASGWGQAYFAKLRSFYEQTGFLQFTHDGSYPGDFDAAARPPLQRGLDDSQWVQWRIITEFYAWLRARGVYLRVPDYYYLAGSNECGMGYRETNWSLPRDWQVIHTRQNVYDGTWEKTPSMGWMFVPLTQYHGGGAAATIEPLDAHRDHYRRMLRSNLGLGVQAVYRGTRLYDTPRVRDLVRSEVAWFKEYRDILESDVIHGRRADGRDVDWMLHVNPRLARKALLVVYNPLKDAARRTIRIPLYYAGLSSETRVRHEGAAPTTLRLLRDHTVTLPVHVPPRGMTWYVFE